jgi:hypothetical protein
MNHSEASESAAAAAYTLGELSGPERDAFEMHFIDCPICAQEVWAGNRMLAAGREAVKRPPAKVLPFRPMNWISARAVAAVLAVVAGIQGYVIRNTPSPLAIEVPTSGPVFRSATRAQGEGVEKIRFQGDQSIQFYVEMEPEQQPFPRYQVEIRSASGKILSDDVSEERIRSGDSIPLSVRPLPAGRYVLAIVGVRKDGNRSERARWNFVVQ